MNTRGVLLGIATGMIMLLSACNTAAQPAG
ncbi:MAG: hypothetical protein K0R13_985, partial [Propionibacteriaceae bacterium]|nr:hypothetical protein [Propionibacteriaceae bacterium]